MGFVFDSYLKYCLFEQHTRGISSLELPLIEHREGPDLKKLPSVIQGLSLLFKKHIDTNRFTNV